jgi:2-amino-4-hydroxy-6-hydroxymethyldihydropteridine diphosphokinase
MYDSSVNTVFLALGSNVGDRAENLRRALQLLEPTVSVSKKSKVYESLPVGTTDQPNFYNMTLEAQTALAPHELLRHVKGIEASLGRAPNTHNLPRPIDIDILLYGDEVLETPELTIPHPRMHERAFVMMPLEEIASFYVHPVLRRPMIDLWDDLGAQFETLWEAEVQL